MKNSGSRLIGVILAILISAVTAGATVPRAGGCDPTPLPAGFAGRAYGHAAALAAAGERPAASVGERKAQEYLRKQFQQMGLRTVTEPFGFTSYEVERMPLHLGGATFQPVSVAFNPYAGVFRFEGVASLVDPRDLASGKPLPELENRCVISAPPADFFQLMLRKPKLIVYVNPSDFVRLQSIEDRHFVFTISGRRVRRTSANVIGEVAGRPGATREIIVSAHLDAYRNSPGASDNGSGIGVLIELARHFKTMEGSLDIRLTFVAFGAEELGVLGSRAYVRKHTDELRECVLNVNIDDVGGPAGPSVQTLGGVTGVPLRAGGNLFPTNIMDKAWEGIAGDWRLLDPRLLPAVQASNRPEWLKYVFDESAGRLRITIILTGNSGSDELSFTQAGVAATAVHFNGNQSHSREDTIGQVRPESLETAGRLVAGVVETLARGSAPRQPRHAGLEKDIDISREERFARLVAAISAGADSAERRSAILRRLDELNLKVRTESFSSGSAGGVNILVESDRPADRTLMLGAHYDRVAKGQGAIDNAAGVAAVLELLAAFQDKPLKNHALAAAFFDLEEAGRLGSKAYVSARPKLNELPAFYLNFDIFADGDALWLVSTGEDGRLARAMETAANQQNFALTQETLSPPGDQQAFSEAGVGTLGFSLVRQEDVDLIRRAFRGEKVIPAPPLMNIVHSENDTPDKVNGSQVTRALCVVEAAIRMIDARQ